MSASPISVGSTSPAANPAPPEIHSATASPRGASWKKYLNPILVMLLALAVLITITRNWNAWEGGEGRTGHR